MGRVCYGPSCPVIVRAFVVLTNGKNGTIGRDYRQIVLYTVIHAMPEFAFG